MSTLTWHSRLKARVGQRSINVMQVMLVASLGSVVLLRDSLGVGIDISLNTNSPVEAIQSAGNVKAFGPKRNIASVDEKNDRELESVPDPTDFSDEQPPARKQKKPRGEVVDQEDPGKDVQEKAKKVVVDKANNGDGAITEFDKARQKRGKPRGQAVNKDHSMVEEDPTDSESKEVEHMLPREFTIPEDLRDLQSEEEKVGGKKPKKQPKNSKKEPRDNVPVREVLVDNADDAKKQTVGSKGKQREDEVIEEVVDGHEEPATASVGPKPLLEEPVFSGQPFSLGKTPQNWDQQRTGWLEKYPWMKTTPNGKQRMLMITGSSPWACKNSIGDHLQLKSLKNKIDYTRQHGIELFYNVAHLEKELTSYWAKLPIIRKLMLTHPEIEWFFWMDADAMFTDMLFEIPMERYEGYNMVMWGWEEALYQNRSWVAINDGAFFFRNCQWSLDLLDMWAPMGPEGDVRTKWGEFFSEYMSERTTNFPADDQSALVYLILTKPELQAKIKLEWDYELSGYWEMFVDKFEDFMTLPGNHPGVGGKSWPFIVHFTGCQPCTGRHNPKYSGEECVLQMERAYNFADNQVLQTMGFMHENLNSSHLKKVYEESDEYNIVETVSPNTWTTASVSYGL